MYLYDIGNSNKNIKTKNYSTFDIKPLCWNAMLVINENKNLVGIGCNDSTFILQINDIDKINVIKEIKIKNDYCLYDALCLYQNIFLILGTRQGNMYFFDINNNYEFIKAIENAHQYIKDSNASINGITELSDGSFASFGEDKKIKIWYF